MSMVSWGGGLLIEWTIELRCDSDEGAWNGVRGHG